MTATTTSEAKAAIGRARQYLDAKQEDGWDPDEVLATGPAAESLVAGDIAVLVRVAEDCLPPHTPAPRLPGEISADEIGWTA